MLRCKQAFFVSPTLLIPAGALVADDDPIVKGREAMFEPAAPTVSTRGVEEATANPGEKRTTTRKAKASE